jgi:predicted amidophosphoribosyltransferase
LEAIIPFAYLLSFSAIVPLARVVLFTRRQRNKNTHACAVCGYDLRATPDRCPECGNAIDGVA